MIHRPFRFGALLYEPFEGRTWADTAREVESLGYASIGLTDHFQGQHAPIPVMAMVTAATERLVAASMMLANDFRHPLVLAKELATLDLESGGRIEWGVGAGWKRVDYDVSGIPFDRPGVRIDRMREAIEIVRRCLAGEPFSFEGTHYTVRDYEALPRPARPGGPPLMIGGGGPRVLRLAGSVADIVGINPNLGIGRTTTTTAAEAREADWRAKLDAVAEGAASAGRLVDDIEFTTIASLARVTDGAARTAAVLEEAAERYGLPPGEVAELNHVFVGSTEEIVEQLVDRRERFGVSYVVFDQSSVRDLAPVVRQLTGR